MYAKHGGPSDDGSWTRRMVVCLVLAAPLCVLACRSEATLDPQLAQAVESARYLTSQRFLGSSGIQLRAGPLTPSEVVDYLFSDFGVAEWPIALDSFEEEQLRSIRVPALPPDVAIVAHEPDRQRGPQVVLRADDAAGVVILEAYENGFVEPILREQRRLGE